MKKYIQKVDFETALPPMSSDIERAVLGGVLVSNSVSEKVMADFSEDIFYMPANKIIAKAIIELYKENSAIDLITVANKIKTKNQIKEIGGTHYIASLTSNVAGDHNIEWHIKILQQESLRRSLLNVCSQAINNAFNDEVDVFDLYSETQKAIDDSLKSVLHYEVESISDIHQDNLKESL